MKKLSLFLSAIVLLASCSKDVEPPPNPIATLPAQVSSFKFFPYQDGTVTRLGYEVSMTVVDTVNVHEFIIYNHPYKSARVFISKPRTGTHRLYDTTVWDPAAAKEYYHYVYTYKDTWLYSTEFFLNEWR